MKYLWLCLFFISRPLNSQELVVTLPFHSFQWTLDKTWTKVGDGDFETLFNKPWKELTVEKKMTGFEPLKAYQSQQGTILLLSRSAAGKPMTEGAINLFFQQLVPKLKLMGTVMEDSYTLGEWNVRHLRLETPTLVVMKALFHKPGESPIVLDYQIPNSAYNKEIQGINHSFQLMKSSR